MLLRHINPIWSRVPRTYVVLRSINSLNMLDSCIDVGLSDYWFPIKEQILPKFLRPSIKAAFVDAQKLILTKSMDLEKGEHGRHCYLQKGDLLPFERKAVLGIGGYGQVDKVLSLISFKEYARKRVLRSAAFSSRKKEVIKQFISEIEILKRLKHRHVVEFVGSYTDAKYIGLIMTPIAKGDLSSYLVHATPAEHPELRSFFGCLATALEFLHLNNVRHKDIKPRNILVSKGQVLFADFGLSFDFTDATGSTTMGMVNGMTPRYCAPEVANHEARNTMSDIWSLGIVFLEMIVTLKGKTMEYMDNFLKQNGSRQTFIRLNAAALPDFIAHLTSLPQWTDNRALDWTASMLQEVQVSRPTASALVTQITSPTGGGEQTGFCGICCMVPEGEDEDEDFSDYLSD
ncbi:kinase-like domain-containing protein [Paraphoma chrysanthemicola]|nr:kinase-like domain-containing protein [Paraphoma chrysanthemicola]